MGRRREVGMFGSSKFQRNISPVLGSHIGLKGSPDWAGFSSYKIRVKCQCDFKFHLVLFHLLYRGSCKLDIFLNVLLKV